MRVLKSFLIIFPATLLLLLAVNLQVEAGKPEGSSVDPKKVYYGDPDNFSSPAVISIAAVFDHISAYKKIKQDNIKPDDPRYWRLLEEANRVFYEAVRRTAQRRGFDLVGEIGYIKIKDKDLENITSAVIKTVEEVEKGQ